MTQDGHRLLSSNSKTRFISSSRWNELTDAISFHAGLANAASAISEFRFLNGQTVRIGDGLTDMSVFRSLLDVSPGGGTPLCRHIREVIAEIQKLRPMLHPGQKACVVIFTDGESSDGDIAKAMAPLQDLPVWVVIRLCTDEERIVNYWNNIDNELELDMDVLDDLKGEAEEVTSINPWLTYGEPLHRLREFGIPVKEIDLLDELKLSKDQIRVICSIM